MPESILNALFATPTCTLGALEPVEVLSFIIDQGIEPDALASLYQLGEPFEPSLLFKDTEFDALARQGPFCFGAQPGSVLAEQAAALCLARGCGVLLVAPSLEQAAAHAASLLQARDSACSRSLLSFAKPSIWAALALTAGPHAPRLFGPTSQVLTPAPSLLQLAEYPWYRWHAPAVELPVAPQSLYDLPPDFGSAAHALRLLYWLDNQHAVFNTKASQVPTAVANLQTLIDHGIRNDRNLKRLPAVVTGPRLTGMSEAMHILRGSDLPSIKVEQLARLDSRTDARR